MADKNKSAAYDRAVKGFLKPSTYAYFDAYKQINEMGKSEALNVIVKSFFDSMPAEERARLLNKDRNTY